MNKISYIFYSRRIKIVYKCYPLPLPLGYYHRKDKIICYIIRFCQMLVGEEHSRTADFNQAA